MTITEIAEYLNVSERYVLKLLESGKLKSTSRTAVQSLDESLKRQQEKALQELADLTQEIELRRQEKEKLHAAN